MENVWILHRYVELKNDLTVAQKSTEIILKKYLKIMNKTKVIAFVS